MGRAPCCDKKGLKKGPWTPEEDKKLVDYINKNDHGSWRSLPKLAGLLRCGKSCRLRWTNYLRPDIKRGPFSAEEEKLVVQLHGILGNRWAAIASQLPGRTDNEIKNLWNTHLKKRLVKKEKESEFPVPAVNRSAASPGSRHTVQWETVRLEADARLSRESLHSTPSSTTAKPNSEDFFLRLWNSEVGETFRNIKTDKSQISTSCVSGAVALDTKDVHNTNGDDSCGSSGVEEQDSSESSLQLLLDFPNQNDMSFLGNDDCYGFCNGYLFDCCSEDNKPRFF